MLDFLLPKRLRKTSEYDLSRQAFGGPVTAFHLDERTGQPAPNSHIKHRNTILYAGADIMGKLLGGQSNYRIGAMYFEFCKSTTTYSPGSVARTQSDYFQSLLANGSANTDFLRVPLDVTPAWTASDDSGNFATNVVRFFAQTGDNVGERQLINSNGLTFDVGDIVVGGALVATPTASITDDVVYAQFYFLSANQIQKINGHQVVFTWPISFN